MVKSLDHGDSRLGPFGTFRDFFILSLGHVHVHALSVYICRQRVCVTWQGCSLWHLSQFLREENLLRYKNKFIIVKVLILREAYLT